MTAIKWFVYAMQFGDHMKIGFTTNLAGRYRAHATARGRDGIVLGHARMYSEDDARLLERRLQFRFGVHRLDGEWFRSTPEVIAQLRALLNDPAATKNELASAREAREELQPRTAQKNVRVVMALAKTVAVALPPNAPPELLIDELLAKCRELRIEVDDEIAKRALRSAARQAGPLDAKPDDSAAAQLLTRPTPAPIEDRDLSREEAADILKRLTSLAQRRGMSVLPIVKVMPAGATVGPDNYLADMEKANQIRQQAARMSNRDGS